MLETSLTSEDYLLLAETKDSWQRKFLKKCKTSLFSSLEKKKRNLLPTIFDKTHRGLRTRESSGVERLLIEELEKIQPADTGN